MTPPFPPPSSFRSPDDPFEALMMFLRDHTYQNVILHLDRSPQFDLNRIDPQTGDTPLTLAARTNCQGLVTKLIDHGAKVDMQDRHNILPLYAAAERNAYYAVRELIEAGANVNYQDRYGHTALMAAACQDAAYAIMSLTMNGADVFLQDNDRKTAKDHAIDNGHTGSALMLQLVEEKMQRAEQNEREQRAHERTRAALKPDFKFRVRR